MILFQPTINSIAGDINAKLEELPSPVYDKTKKYACLVAAAAWDLLDVNNDGGDNNNGKEFEISEFLKAISNFDFTTNKNPEQFFQALISQISLSVFFSLLLSYVYIYLSLSFFLFLALFCFILIYISFYSILLYNFLTLKTSQNQTVIKSTKQMLF